MNNEPINGVKILVNDSTQARTNKRGEYALECVNGTELRLGFSHAMFNAYKTTKSVPSKKRRDTLHMFIRLTPIKTKVLSEVIVSAPGVPQTVFATDTVSVSDFEILDDGKLLLLTYPKQLKKENKLIIMDGNRLLSTFSVNDRAEELVHDYRGNPHLICSNKVYGIVVKNDQVGLADIDKTYFLKFIAPIIDTNKTNMYFSNYSDDIPSFDYYQYNQEDSIYKKIQKIQDDLMMELYRSEYKYVDIRTKLWAKNKELETGIDAELWVGANYFTQSIYYRSLYAPMFQRNDSLFIFDHYQDLLRTYNADGDSLASIPIYYHYDKRATGWTNEVIQDRGTGDFYIVYDRAGYSYVSKIDTENGKVGNQVQLNFRYVDNISILDNHVYYIYRPFESAQKKYLYKERLPY